jgi:uncharacterized protein with beta-barrel porin domain
LSVIDGMPAMSDHSARELSLYLEALPASQPTGWFEPTIAMRYARSSEDRYVEAGSSGSLAVAGRTSQWLTSDVGVRLAREVLDGKHLLRLKAVWSHDHLDSSTLLRASLVGDNSGEAFSVVDPRVARDRFKIEMSLHDRAHESLSLHLNCAVNDSSLGSRGVIVGARVARTW